MVAMGLIYEGHPPGGARWTITALKQAVIEQPNLAQCCLALGTTIQNDSIKRAIVEYNIDISHWPGTSKKGIHNYKKVTGRKRPQYKYEEILIKNSPISRSNHLKDRLLRDGLLKKMCYICSNEGKWLDKKLRLELDHINGDRQDWRLENLRILCPNCHTQTDTYNRGTRLWMNRTKLKKEESLCSDD